MKDTNKRTGALVQAPCHSRRNVPMTFLQKMFREFWRRVRYLYTMASAIPAFQGVLFLLVTAILM